MKDVSALLVANRGEIALRIMRTARAMGLRTIAVHSDADADAPHVRFADKAARIGPAPATQSYLSIDALISAAKASGATAIHPGYGFLSESAAFARAAADAGLTFIGPPPTAIEAMGDKARARRRMMAAGVPCAPGYDGEDQTQAAFARAAAEIGYPVMVKAAAGGGGRGMRLVKAPGDLANALELARNEAQNAFGDKRLILEKAIVRPRHVEIQILADSHGHVIHLGERDCSMQRRHQKVVEEAPCPMMTPELRARMGAAAVEAARAVEYEGAGTVEFLLDASNAFYFLEMNTRLQVEHPVTEMITGLDLVALQLRVASGEPLGLSQDDIGLNGHAIEARLYAEDPEAGFLPSSGKLRLFRTPDGVRVDSGVQTGGEVSSFYDPMIAKVIAHGASRDEARRRLLAALGETALFGLRSNRDFLIDALGRPAFVNGETTTAFIHEIYGDRFCPPPAPSQLLAAAAVLQHLCDRRRAEALGAASLSPELFDWSSTHALQTIVEYEVGGAVVKLSVRPRKNLVYDVGPHEVRVVALDEAAARLTIDGETLSVVYCDDGERLNLATPHRSLEVRNRVASHTSKAGADGQKEVTAPMHGRLAGLFVAEGDIVKAGDRLAVLEAMKMQHELVAAIDGRVKRIHALPGAQIAANALILEIDPQSRPSGGAT